jgi:FdhD protein
MHSSAREGTRPGAVDAHADELKDGIRVVPMTRLEAGRSSLREEAVATEEPLEIQIGPVSLAVVMRTPGNDIELVRGFLVSERVVQGPEDVVSVRHCTLASSPEARDNVVRVLLRSGVELDLESLRRNLFASSSCGVCGKATIENALSTAGPIEDAARFDASFLSSLEQRLRAEQNIFEHTGGLHAAGLFGPGGDLLVAREDVGRHNAVDKVIGWALEAGRLPLSGHVLMVSGRISFELVQKALAARIPLLAAVSAPTSLAVSLAEASGLTLVGFVRGTGMNVYSTRGRVVGLRAMGDEPSETAP